MTPHKGKAMLSEAFAPDHPTLRLVALGRSAEEPAPPSLVERLDAAPLRALRAREHVFTEGDHRSQLYRVESGAVCLYKVLDDGRRQVLAFAYPGEVFGLGPAGPHRYHAQTTQATRLRCLSWSALQRAARRDTSFALGLYEMTARELAASHELLLTAGQRTATERVASFLLSVPSRSGGDDVQLPMTRADIGDLLALSLETVSRALSRLRRLGLIKLEQSSRIQILDRHRLEMLAKGSREF
jgi:CRP/FNR family transcriptional regulator